MIEVQSRTSCEDLIKEKDEEIKKLEEEKKQLKLERDTAMFVAKERLDEIERIKNQKEIFELRYLKADKEIERLNNIINELEKDMIFDMNDYGKDLDIQTGNIYSEYYRGYCQNGKDYYDRLQELKGVDKE